MSNDAKFVISYINEKPGLVIRNDDGKAMESSIQEIMPVFRDFEKQFNVTPKGNPVVKQTPYQSAPAPKLSDDIMEKTPCNKCKGPRILSKNGNWVCKDFCWTK